jgi:ankyrin repeat protein
MKKVVSSRLSKVIIFTFIVSLFFTGCISVAELWISEDSLYYAVRDGDVETVKSAIKAGHDANMVFSGEPLIVLAAERNELEIAKILLENGADINQQRDYDGYTALMSIAEGIWGSNVQLVELLLNNGADVNMVDIDGKGALEYAVNSSSDNFVTVSSMLIDAGSDLELNDFGAQILYFASENGYDSIVESLMARKINPNIELGQLRFSIIEASEAGHSEIVKMLVEGGADPNVITKFDYTALMYASMEGYSEIVKTLLDAGADPNKEMEEETALTFAVEENEPEIVRLLIDAGADYNLKMQERTPIVYAIQRHNDELVRVFIDAGADVKAKGENGIPLLNLACEYRDNLEAVRALLEAGADPNEANYFDDRRPLYYAIRSGSFEMVKLLITKGAEINFVIKYDDSHTPLTQAVDNGRIEIVVLLLEKGADVFKTGGYYDKTALDIAKDKRNLDLVNLLEKYTNR